MKNKILIIVFIIVATIALLFVRTKYSDYNLEKTVSACVMAKKQTSKSFDQEKAKKYCDKVLIMPETNIITAPIIYSLPIQLIAYHLAVLLGTDVDQPRNLAKSVTVK